MDRWRLAAAIALAAWLGLAAPAVRASDDQVTIMVGGAEKQIYLPVVLADRLGLFARHGVDVRLLTDLSGVDAEDELLAGAVQGVVGFYDHTIELQAKGKMVESVIQLARIPGESLLAANRHQPAIQAAGDLRNLPLGVTGLGSSTNVLVKYLAITAGLKPTDLKFVAVGAGDSFIDALHQGRIVGGMTTEPTASRLEKAGDVHVVAELRTLEGTRAALGGWYPAACLYMRTTWVQEHPDTVRRIVAALLEALQFLQTHSPQDVAERVPPQFLAGGRALYIQALGHGLEMFTADGRMPPQGPENVLRVLKLVDPFIRNRAVDLSRTYTSEFLDAR